VGLNQTARLLDPFACETWRPTQLQNTVAFTLHFYFREQWVWTNRPALVLNETLHNGYPGFSWCHRLHLQLPRNVVNWRFVLWNSRCWHHVRWYECFGGTVFSIVRVLPPPSWHCRDVYGTGSNGVQLLPSSSHRPWRWSLCVPSKLSYQPTRMHRVNPEHHYKGKAVPVLNELSIILWRRMGSGGIALPLLTSALDECGWSAWRPDRFTPGEWVPCTHLIGVWVGLRVGLESVGKKTILPLPGIELRSSSP
jgi:hypothetical protein